MAMKHGIAAFAAGLAQSILVALVAILVPASAHADWYQPENLMSLDDLDGIVAEEYASLTNFAFIYPPRTELGTNVCFSHIELWGGWYTFSPEGGVAGVTNYIQPTLHYGIPMWKLAVIETTDVSRVWLYLAPDGTSFATNDTPASLDANHKVSDWSYNNGTPIAGRTITRDEAGVKIQEQVTAGLFPNPQSPRRSANTFDTADRLVAAALAVGTNTFSETYLYDGNGALTNRHSAAGDWQYEYDFAGRLIYSLSSTANSLVLTYDALGNRLTTYSANATRISVTDHADPRKRPLMEADANGVPLRYYIWGGGLLLAVVEADGTVHYAHSDEQGSVIALTDSAGTVTDQYCYGPYGTDWGHSGTNSIPFRWLGSHGVFNVCGSSLHLTRYRTYDTYTGRFLSSDPIGLGGGPNLYVYCMGNPLAYIDPLGLGAEARYNNRLDTISGAKALLQNQYGPVMGFLSGYVADILNRSVTTAYKAEKTGISPENAFVLGQIQGISEASAVSATAGLLGLLGGETLGSATALLPIAGTVTGQVLPRGEGVLVAITPSGTVISSGNLMLSHSVFAQQAGLVTSNGGLVPGAFVGTAFNNSGMIAVLNSMSFYGNQALASPSVQAIVGSAITAR